MTKQIVKVDNSKIKTLSKLEKKDHNTMSIVDIINDRKSGELAPSEVVRRKKMLESRKNRGAKDDTVTEQSMKEYKEDVKSEVTQARD